MNFFYQRARKCSIVREEEDDEEGSAARRGSRSEGRLHLAVQDRIPPALTTPAVPVVTKTDKHSKSASGASKVRFNFNFCLFRWFCFFNLFFDVLF